MARFGKIFRCAFGDRKFNTSDRPDSRAVRAIKHKVQERKALDFYGKKYNSLNPAQKRHIRQKAQDLIRKGATE